MRADEVRDLSDAEIAARVGELEEERFRLRFRGATETLDDPLRQRVIRREVARMKTILRERALGTSPGAAGAAAGTPARAKKKATTPRRTARKGGKS
jgi:large subunit ribosomal protein L29